MRRTSPEFETALKMAIDSKAKPIGSLGRLEEVAARICRLQGTLRPVMKRCELVIFAADHGIASRGVSAYPQAVTRQMVLNFLDGGAASNVIAATLGITMRVIDAGVAGAPIHHPHLSNRSLASGTADFSQEPAMTGEQLAIAIARGADAVKETRTDAICLGEMGIGNTSSATLIAHKLLGLDLAGLVGRGTGLDDAGIDHKLSVLQLASARTHEKMGWRSVLVEYGGFEIAMMVGAMISAAEMKRIVIVDGFIATAAAVAALKCRPDIEPALFFAHVSAERGHALVLEALKVRPLLDLEMRLGEGTGAMLAWPILKSAGAFINDMATFESAGVSEKS